jgi:hypothetical protein
MNLRTNIPYTRKSVFQITKENPYISGVSIKSKKTRKSNNTQGHRLVVSKIGVVSFMRHEIRNQRVGKKLIVHAIPV